MKPCAHVEALEGLALASGDERAGAGDAWLEAHVGECEACAAELDRLLEERALFVRRARALDVPLDPSGVFVEIDRRRERFRRGGVLASMFAAAAACMAMAFAPVTSSRAVVRALTEPTPVELGAMASWDEAPMTLRIAACMPSESDRAACDAPADVRVASGGGATMTSGGGGATWPTACVADVTCSVARP
jgi:hypothetical protein